MIARTIQVATIPVTFLGDDRAARLIERRYGAFVCPPRASGAAVEVELCLRPLRAVNTSADEPLDVVVRADRIVLEGAGLYAEVALDLSSARVQAPLAERPIDAVVRFLLASHLLSRGGLLVHASAVRIRDRAWVFVGPSGAGKTTIATQLRGELMCDEAVALVPDTGGAVAFSTPYWRARPARAPIAGLLFLDRSGRTEQAPSWRALSPGQAVAHLLPSAGPLLPSTTPRALSAADHLLHSIACARLMLPTISHIRDWLQPRLDAAAPRERSAQIGAAAR